MHFQGTFFQIFPKMGKIYDNFALLGKKYALKGPILAFFSLFSPFPPFLFPFSPFLSIFFFFPFFFFLFFFPKHEFFISPRGVYICEYIYPCYCIYFLYIKRFRILKKSSKRLFFPYSHFYEKVSWRTRTLVLKRFIIYLRSLISETSPGFLFSSSVTLFSFIALADCSSTSSIFSMNLLWYMAISLKSLTNKNSIPRTKIMKHLTMQQNTARTAGL